MNAVSIRIENALLNSGIKIIAGVDEAGIGPLAGPVVAAAVILDKLRIAGLDDSKKLSSSERDRLYIQIIEHSLSIGIGIVDIPEIDSRNILQATFLAMRAAVDSLSITPDHLLVDGIRNIPGSKIAQTCVKHGDGRSRVIAAASVMAKVTRDRIMEGYDVLYPQYGFSAHKGYGTEEHMKNLKKHGPSPIHRKSYDPVAQCLVRKGILFI